MHRVRANSGFTIVELLIVIVVIAILAAITIVSYNGITQQARNSSLQSELSTAIKKIESFKTASGTETYPSTATAAGLPASSTLNYYYDASANSYCVETKSGQQGYSSLNNGTVLPVSCAENGALGIWKLNGDGLDASPNANNGTVANTTNTVGQNGSADAAMMFINGSNSSVSIPSNTALATEPQSFSFWINPINWAPSTASTMIGKRSGSANGYFIAYLNSSNSLIFDCGGLSQRWTTTYAPPLGTWTHIVFTCSSNPANPGENLYVNGALDSSRSTVISRTAINNATNLRFGQDPSGGTLFLNGSLDDVRIFNRVIGPQEVNAMYNANAQ